MKHWGGKSKFSKTFIELLMMRGIDRVESR